MRVLTAADSRAADGAAMQAGVETALLMEAAGRAVAGAVARLLAGRLRGAPVLVLCGSGSNGGDGLAAARALADAGARVHVLVAQGPKAYAARGEEAARWLGRLAPYGIEVGTLGGEEVVAVLQRAPQTVVVDAVTGTGARGPLREDAAQALAAAREGAAAVVAVDLPSGVDPDTGEAALGAVPADVTVAMGFLKLGHLFLPGRALCGRLMVAPIGLCPFAPQDGPAAVKVLDPVLARDLAPVRPLDLHKGQAGRVALWAGSPGLGGAAVLAARGALASGAGLVYALTTQEVRQALLASHPEVMARVRDEDPAGAKALLATVQACAVGPGLGRDAQAWAGVRTCLEEAPAVVIDADGLFALAHAAAQDPLAWEAVAQSPAGRFGRLVLTPHLGEAARLWESLPPDLRGEDLPPPPWNGRQRLMAARTLARACHGVVVLKGQPTVVARPDGEAALGVGGSPVLAVGGSGDVLTGLVAGLLAQGMTGWDAARLGVYVHGVAAYLAAAAHGSDPHLDRGLGSGQVADALPAAWQTVRRAEWPQGAWYPEEVPPG